MPYPKATFIYVLLVIDFISIFLIIWFINNLEYQMKRYHKCFDKRSVEMSDFTVKISNLPFDH